MPDAQVHGAQTKGWMINKSVKQETKDYKQIRAKMLATLGKLYPEYARLAGISLLVKNKMARDFGVKINYNKDYSIIFISQGSTILASFPFEFNGSIWCQPYRKLQNVKAGLFALEYCLNLKQS